ncbi:MAG: phosphate acyltransferase PlsX [Chloroflexota bacterium]|nr:phosphate acyltransferase PlsX [Chloroflexota bacterium]
MTNYNARAFRVSLDAMGGDFGPSETVPAAIEAVASKDLEVLLVGDPKEIHAEITRYSAQALPLQIIPSEGVIRDDESPLQALRAKPKASAVIGVGLVKEGLADAFVTMGSTGAAMAASAFGLGLMEGIDRPALGGPIYGLAEKTVLIELGSSIDCNPTKLLNFAALGVAFARTYLDIENPRVALLSVGSEANKGNKQMKETFPVFQQSGLNFIGNVEGHDVVSDTADVIVCDGFVGNILLKAFEGIGDTLATYMKQRLSGLLSDADASSVSQDVYDLLNRTEHTGGGPLFGIKGNVIVGHGRARATAISGAIATAKRLGEISLTAKMQEELASIQVSVPA